MSECIAPDTRRILYKNRVFTVAIKLDYEQEPDADFLQKVLRSAKKKYDIPTLNKIRVFEDNGEVGVYLSRRGISEFYKTGVKYLKLVSERENRKLVIAKIKCSDKKYYFLSFKDNFVSWTRYEIEILQSAFAVYKA